MSEAHNICLQRFAGFSYHETRNKHLYRLRNRNHLYKKMNHYIDQIWYSILCMNYCSGNNRKNILSPVGKCCDWSHRGWSTTLVWCSCCNYSGWRSADAHDYHDEDDHPGDGQRVGSVQHPSCVPAVATARRTLSNHYNTQYNVCVIQPCVNVPQIPCKFPGPSIMLTACMQSWFLAL